MFHTTLHPETPNLEASKAPKVGPAVLWSNLSHPSTGETRPMIRVLVIFPIMILRNKEQLCHFLMHEVLGVSRTRAHTIVGRVQNRQI
jgi:hypothetical protein